VILRLAAALRQRESMGSDRSLSVPGAAVFVIASKHDDGKLSSARLYVEKDGQLRSSLPGSLACASRF